MHVRASSLLGMSGTAMLSALAAFPATAQIADFGPQSEITSSPDRLLDAWREQHGASWRMLGNPATGSLEMLYGGNAQSPFEPNTNNAEDWYLLGRHWIAETAAMHGIDADTLVESRFRYLPLGQGNTTDKITVRFEQVVGGVPVADGAVNVLFDTQGRLLSIHVTAAPSVETASGRPTIKAGFANLVASREFQAEFGLAPTSYGNERLAHVAIDDQETRRWALVWQVEAMFEGDGQPIGRRYSIDAHGRDVLKSENTVHNFDVFGTVSSNASPGLLPAGNGNGAVAIPMPRIRVASSAGTVTTDRDGNFNISGVNTPIDLTVDYFGTFTDVVDNTAGASDYTITFTNVQPNQQNNLLINPNPTVPITAQANAHLHINVVRDFIRDRFPTDGTADFRARANVNIDDNCNATWSGNAVNFFTAGGGCSNTSYSTVVAHEMGHWLNSRYGTGNGADGMGEGNADVFAMYTYDDAVVGRNFSGTGAIRTGTNNRQFCGDNNPGCHQNPNFPSPHNDGEVWMGAAWKIRTNLNNSLGNSAGDLQSDLLFLGWMNSFNQTQIRSIIETQWLTLDDDDGNLDNGTPNYPAIDAGFRQQGFPGVDIAIIAVSSVTNLADTTDESGPYDVSAQVTNNGPGSITSVDLMYRVGGTGAFSMVPMSNTSGITFEGGIPGISGPAIVEYFVRAADDTGNSTDFPGNGRPFNFFVGDITPILVTDFESGAVGWTSGAAGDDATTGLWAFGNPIGTEAQPENDNSMPGTDCWFTGQGSIGGGLGENDVDGGSTTLLSPVFDAASSADLYLSYSRWYSNVAGNAPNADVFEVDVSTDGGSTWTTVENVGPAGDETEGGWIESTISLSDLVTPTSTMRLRFIATDAADGSIVEAAIDDVDILSLGDVIPDPTRFCISNPNSTGVAATIGVSGTTSISANNFALFASNLPGNSFGLFFFGDTQVQSPIGGSMGTLCVSGNTFRLPPVQADSFFGNAVYAVDFQDASTNAVQITAGSTWNFQMWFRDAVGGSVTSNTTDGMLVGFTN